MVSPSPPPSLPRFSLNTRNLSCPIVIHAWHGICTVCEFTLSRAAVPVRASQKYQYPCAGSMSHLVHGRFRYSTATLDVKRKKFSAFNLASGNHTQARHRTASLEQRFSTRNAQGQGKAKDGENVSPKGRTPVPCRLEPYTAPAAVVVK